MCAIAGIVDYNRKAAEYSEAVSAMSASMHRRGPNAEGLSVLDNAAVFGHRRLIVIDPLGGAQPMTAEGRGGKYTIVYNGEMYNTEEIRAELIVLKHKFRGHSDTEVILHAFIEWGVDCLKKINGIFAIAVWCHSLKRLIIARDRLGVKPLFYAVSGNRLVFASELKGILSSGVVKPQVDTEGLRQIFLLSPAREIGAGVIKGVEELKPAEFAVFDINGIWRHIYWELKAAPHTDSYRNTVERTRELVTDSIERQLVSDVPLATFLSGGLDSSIISYVAAKKLAEKNMRLTTYSVDYQDNALFFKSNTYQPSTDEQYIKLMSEYIKSRHINIVLDNEDVGAALYEAAAARDLPGMADIDSSLLLFARHLKEYYTVGLSGECADEIFGGYPWYHNKEILEQDGFPWARSMELRKSLIALPEVKNGADDWVMAKYNATVNSTDYLEGETAYERRMREMYRLNVYWFMQCLLERKDRMTMYNGLEVRVPFCDYRLMEYTYNMPWKYKSVGGREKGILREAFVDLLPYDIVHRKKNPYPKTFSPIYLDYVKAKVGALLDRGAPLSRFVDVDFVRGIITDPQNIEPFFGQLMRVPQLLGHLIQVNEFFEKYNISVV